MKNNLKMTFDDPTYTTLSKLEETGRFKDKAEVIQVALRLLLTLQENHKKGYTRVFLTTKNGFREIELDMPTIVVER